MPTTYFTHETESIFQNAYYIPETETWGTPDEDVDPVPFAGLTVVPTVNLNRTPVEVNGATLPVAMRQGLANTTWQATGPLAWENIRFLSGIKPTISATSIAGGVVSHTTSDPNSYTFQNKTMKASGCTVSGFSLTGDTQTLDITVDFIGKQAETATEITPASAITPTLYVPYQTSVKIGTVQSKVNKIDFNVSNIWQIVNFLGASNTPNQTIAEIRADGTFKVSMPYEKADALEILSYTGVKACEITNSTVFGGYTYAFTFAFKVAFGDVDGFADTDGVYTTNVNCKILNDNTNGKAISLSATKTAVSAGE